MSSFKSCDLTGLDELNIHQLETGARVEMSAQERTASQAYLEVAAAHGVEYVFGLPGTSGQEFIGTIADQERVRFVLALHETCVVSMADGHARVTGRPSLAQVSTLPGSASQCTRRRMS